MNKQLEQMLAALMELISCTEEMLRQASEEKDQLIEDYMERREAIISRLQDIQWSPEASRQIEQWLVLKKQTEGQQTACRLYRQVQGLIDDMASLDQQVEKQIELVRDELAEQLTRTDKRKVRTAKIAGYGKVFNNTLMAGGTFNRRR